MSVLIKGMEKPEHCGYCRFRYDGICHALQKTQYNMNECPLIDENVIMARSSAERKGKWMMIDYSTARCSECGEIRKTNGRDLTMKGHIFYGIYRYCPNCGARMEREEE